MTDIQKTREMIIRDARQQPELAMERANALVAEFPREVWVWSIRSHVFDTRGDLERAQRDIDEAINLRFEEPSSHFSKARYCMKQFNFENAIFSFTNAINIGENLDYLYHDSICRFMRAFCYCKIEDFGQAEADLHMVDDDMQTWIDRLRTKTELLNACHNKRLE